MSAMPWTGSKDPYSDNRGPTLAAAIWACAAVATPVVALRFYTRIKHRGGLKADDYLIGIALVFAITANCLFTGMIHFGYGRHVYYLTAVQLTSIRKLQFGVMAVGSIALCAARVSFAVSLLILMGTNPARRWFLWFTIVQHVTIVTTCFLMTMLYCQPVKKFWYPKIAGTCMDPATRKNSGYAMHASNIFTDLVLAAMPALIISALNLRFAMKVGLGVLMSLGFFNMAAAVVTLYYYINVGNLKDITYDPIPVYYWVVAQNFLVPVIISIPFLRPLFVGKNYLSWSWYRGLARRRSVTLYDYSNSEQNSNEPEGRHEPKGLQSLPHIPQDRFVTTTLKGAGPGMATDVTRSTSCGSCDRCGSLSTLAEQTTQPSHSATSKV